MGKISREDYLLFMFSMKGPNKKVDFDHCKEKITRDLGKTSDKKIKDSLESLVRNGFLAESPQKNLYYATDVGRNHFAKQFFKLRPSLLSINRAWTIVYQAKQYYPIVADTIMEFCRGRNTGFYCLFTKKRFFRRDFRGKKIELRSAKDLLFFVNIHCIDVIPCVHRIGEKRPDWLVADIDAGPEVSWERTKECAAATYRVFDRFGLNPVLKFSGSRGFQVWSLISDFEMPNNYVPFQLAEKTKREKNYFSLFADFIRVIQHEVASEIPETTCDVSARERRKNLILIDPSSMKMMGLVRSPYAVHSKTGLVSMPLQLNELEDFEPEHARMELVLERYQKKGNEFVLRNSDPKKLLDVVLA
jgi:DNA primase